MARDTSGLKRGGSPGRKPGVPNKATQAGQEFAQKVLSDPEYRRKLEERAKRGKLPPAVECMLWDRAYGKVKEHVEVTGENGGPFVVMFGGRHKPKTEDDE